MNAYLANIPFWAKWLFPPGLLWEVPDADSIFLTFDDGPHAQATPFILQQLQQYNAKGTFFCLGKNVANYPHIYSELMANGHKTGNHTYNHVNGSTAPTNEYLQNIAQATDLIDSNLFRPPYGRITRSQVTAIRRAYPNWTICMWSVLSGDYDTRITPEQCLKNVLRYLKPGSIVVFHDSDKAWPRMQYALPRVLEYCAAKGWKMEAIP
jgi:peptidoglycan-N-acetylglucosamine deacetylase